MINRNNSEKKITRSLKGDNKVRKAILLILSFAIFYSTSVHAQIKIEPNASFPAEGAILEGDWGNYLLWDNYSSRKLRLGVSNDGYTRAEILLENNNSAQGSLLFKTASKSGGVQSRMIIDHFGNVGIGSLAPVGKLDVAGLLYLRASPTHSIEAEQLRIGRSDQDIRYHSIFSSHSGAASGNYLKFSLHRGGESPYTSQNTVMTLLGNGNVGIGTTRPDSKLSVNGNIRAKEVKVEATNWPDYVFEEGYERLSLEELEFFIQTNGHLPGFKTASEYEKEGVNMLELNQKLVEKIEELTLYLLDTHQRIQELGKLEEKVKLIEEQLNDL